MVYDVATLLQYILKLQIGTQLGMLPYLPEFSLFTSTKPHKHKLIG